MTDFILLGITIALSVAPLALAARFNLHMLQLNGYVNSEHFTWLNENFKKQWLLLAICAAGIMQIVFISVWLLIVSWLFLLLTFVIYRLMKEMYDKKPLHYTTRAKRMLVTDSIFCLIISGLTYWILGPLATSGAICLCVGLQFVLVPFSNTVNRPVEHLVRDFYINQAKKRLRSCENLTIIGVTGSYGKTSMKFYLQELLSSKFNVLVTPESYNTPMGIVKTIRESLTPAHDIFICEMGARYVGEIKEICDIVHPHHGVITAVGPAHLMTFGSLDNIAKTKFELADALPEDGKLFLNFDSELVAKQLFKRIDEKKLNNVVAYSAANGSEVDYVSSIESVTCDGTDFSVTHGGKTLDFHTRLVGSHNVINITGAIAVATEMGVDPQELCSQVRRIKSVPHRMELKRQGRITILDDAFNSNPVGSKAAVETLALFDGMRILITPGMVELGDKEDDYNFAFGGYAAKCCDWIVLVGEEHTRPIKNGALREGFDENKIRVYNTFTEAINFAYKIDCDGKQAFILLENDLPDNYS